MRMVNENLKSVSMIHVSACLLPTLPAVDITPFFFQVNQMSKKVASRFAFPDC